MSFIQSLHTYSLRLKIESHLAFKICPTIKDYLASQYVFYLYLSPLLLLLIFNALYLSNLLNSCTQHPNDPLS
jgi:hypothetical protein